MILHLHDHHQPQTMVGGLKTHSPQTTGQALHTHAPQTMGGGLHTHQAQTAGHALQTHASHSMSGGLHVHHTTQSMASGHDGPPQQLLSVLAPTGTFDSYYAEYLIIYG